MEQREQAPFAADSAAVRICGMTCEELYQALIGIDGYLPDQIRTAAGDLADAEAATAAAVAKRITEFEAVEQRLAAAKHRLLTAAADAASGHYSGINHELRLGRTVHNAIQSGHDATTRLQEHLRLAHLILSDRPDEAPRIEEH